MNEYNISVRDVESFDCMGRDLPPQFSCSVKFANENDVFNLIKAIKSKWPTPQFEVTVNKVIKISEQFIPE